MNAYVIDACVAIKWVCVEPFRVDALRYRNSPIQRPAPDFIYLEISNALFKKISHGDMSQTDALQCLNVLRAPGLLEIFPSGEIIENAFKLANTLQHPVYDCLYLALAERVGAPVVTADRKFFDRACSTFSPSLMAWVEDAPVFSA